MRAVPMAFWTVVVLGIGAGGTWTMIHFRKEVRPKEITVQPPLVRSQVVRSKDMRIDVHTEGTVAPRTEISLVAEVAGRVMKVSESLAAGGFFGEGEVLVQLDDRDYRVAITQAQVRVAQAKVVLSREEAEARIAAREWKELGKGEPSPLTLREPQVQEAKSAVAAAEAALEKARLDLARTVVQAPFAGRVRQKNCDVGQFVGRGSVLARIYAVDYAEVRLPLHDSQLQFLDLPLQYRDGASPRHACRVTLHATFGGREQTWEAAIVRTEGEIDPKSRMVHAVARVDNPYGKGTDPERPPLAVGMFVRATIHGKVFPGVVEVPREAIRTDNRVLVVDNDLRLRFRDVEVLRADYETAVLRAGLKDGERICLSPLTVAVDGMQVRLIAGEDVPDRTDGR